MPVKYASLWRPAFHVMLSKKYSIVLRFLWISWRLAMDMAAIKEH